MIKYKSIFCVAFAAFAALFASCEQVGENERYVAVVPSEPGDTTGSDTAVVDTVLRAVLVEEFSGQLCVNCPAATEALETMQEANGGSDRVVVVSLHAGVGQMLAINETMGQALGYQGLATDFGEQLFSSYGLTSEPNAVINRNSGVLGMGQWATNIVSALRVEANVSLSARTSYDAASRSLTVEVLGRSTDEGGYTGNVHVWLTEDSIVSIQRLEDGYEYDHVFNNIFRASATPMAGEAVSVPYGNEPQLLHTATFTLNEVWRPEHMAVVVFVDNAAGVAQALRVPLVQAADAGEDAAE